MWAYCIDIKNIVTNITRSAGIGRALCLLAGAVLLAGCNNNAVDPDPEPGGEGTKGRLDIRVYIPKGSSLANTYAEEDASSNENRIDTLYVDLYEGGAVIDQKKFYWNATASGEPNLDLNSMIQAGTNDSIVNVGYEVDNITGGALAVCVYANRRTTKKITGEIAVPTNTRGDNTAFLMSGEGSLTKNATTGNYEGTIHIQRDVAKLRVNISKAADFLPSDLEIDYSSVEVQVLSLIHI